MLSNPTMRRMQDKRFPAKYPKQTRSFIDQGYPQKPLKQRNPLRGFLPVLWLSLFLSLENEMVPLPPLEIEMKFGEPKSH